MNCLLSVLLGLLAATSTARFNGFNIMIAAAAGSIATIYYLRWRRTGRLIFLLSGGVLALLALYNLIGVLGTFLLRAGF